VAHAGLATVDVAFVAVFLLVLLALRRVLAHPSMSSACALGVAVGLAIATKFSIFILLPPVAAMTAAVSCWDRRAQWTAALRSRAVWAMLSATTLVAALVVWGIYGFSVGRLEDLPVGLTGFGHQPPDSWLTAFGKWRIPAHEFFDGLVSLGAHTLRGHRATLFDEFSQHGFLLFHPVVFLTKTPEPFLLFAAAGLFGLVRQRDHPEWRWFAGLALGAAGLMAVAMMSSINNGVRHILVLYPLLALASAFGLVRWAERARHARSWLAGAAACIALQLGVLASSVPDQIAYFNVFAGSDPAYISSDSDLDWGQHAIYLERYFAAHPVPELYVQLNGSTRTCEFELPPLKALPLHPVSGWIAVSERIYRLNRGSVRSDPCGDDTIMAPPGWLDWLKAYEPVAIIGKTVRLYYVPPVRSASGGRG
jgi:4-amino-4-deoxy-L-arabinose transferase-like glycosyltransferase